MNRIFDPEAYRPVPAGSLAARALGNAFFDAADGGCAYASRQLKDQMREAQA